ncbi:MAG: cytidine deaminase [Bdellovibrionales bacterium]|nr:cytidine deaminase [Bdellovibrionales bacterium]
MAKITAEVEKAWQTALKARANAHSPYSKFKVGAALKLKGVAEAIPGCNVENASFGATICAERTAFTQAVAWHGRFEPEFLIVATDEVQATVPCALCLQVIAEFSSDNLPIYLANTEGVQKQYTLKDLLPYPFRAFKASP